MRATQTDPFNFETITLSNGSTLYFQHMATAPRVACNIYIHGGNRLEPKAGIADLVDTLLLEGTEKRSTKDIAIALDSSSLDMDVDTKRDYSMVSSAFLAEDLDEATEFMADMLFHSTLQEFEKEKIRTYGELTMELDSARSLAYDVMVTHLFDKSPYQASHSNILATLPTLDSVEPLHAFYRQGYQPKNIFFVVVGNITASHLVSALETYFSTPTQASPLSNSLAEANALTSPLTLKENAYLTRGKDESNQTHLFKAWFAPPSHHPDYAALVVLNTILGGAGLTSRLFLELRDKQGLAYMVRSQYEASRYTGLFTLYIGTDPSNREKALNGFQIECQKLVDTPVGSEELGDAIENIMGRRVVFLETAPQIASYLGGQLALGLSLDQIKAIPQALCAVTSNQVQDMAARLFSSPSVVSAVGPTHLI
jgi:zinc protease